MVSLNALKNAIPDCITDTTNPIGPKNLATAPKSGANFERAPTPVPIFPKMFVITRPVPLINLPMPLNVVPIIRPTADILLVPTENKLNTFPIILYNPPTIDVVVFITDPIDIMAFLAISEY